MVCYGCKQSLPFKTLIPASVALSKEVYYPFLRPLFRALTSQKRHFLSTMEDTAVSSFFLSHGEQPHGLFPAPALESLYDLAMELDLCPQSFPSSNTCWAVGVNTQCVDSPAEGTSTRQWILLHAQEGFHLDLSSPGPV